MRFLRTIILCLLSLDVYAQEIYPSGCVPWPIYEAIPTLTTTQPLILMFHNLSKNNVWIARAVSQRGMQAGLSSLLEAGKWSSLAINVDKNAMPIQCIESKPGHEQKISCAEVLAICQWPKSKFPKPNSGIHWAGENMHLAPLQAFLARQGYGLQ